MILMKFFFIHFSFIFFNSILIYLSYDVWVGGGEETLQISLHFVANRKALNEQLNEVDY